MDWSSIYNLSEIHVDYIEDERKKPFSVKFKTDQIEKIIERQNIL